MSIVFNCLLYLKNEINEGTLLMTVPSHPIRPHPIKFNCIYAANKTHLRSPISSHVIKLVGDIENHWVK